MPDVIKDTSVGLDNLTDQDILNVVEADVALRSALSHGKTRFYLAEGQWTLSGTTLRVNWLTPSGEVAGAYVTNDPIKGETMTILICHGEDDGSVFNLVVKNDEYISLTEVEFESSVD